MRSSRTRNPRRGHHLRHEGQGTPGEERRPNGNKQMPKVRQTPRRSKATGRAKARGKRSHRHATPGTTTMGPVLAYHQVPPAKEGWQGRTYAPSAARWDTLHVNALRRTVDRPAADGLVLQDPHNKTKDGHGGMMPTRHHGIHHFGCGQARTLTAGEEKGGTAAAGTKTKPAKRDQDPGGVEGSTTKTKPSSTESS